MSCSNLNSTVVLIDDNDIDIALHRRIIKRSSCFRDVLSFNYAEDALRWLRTPERLAIDLILLDINMPRMNGFEFLDQAYKEFGTQFATRGIAMLTTSFNPKDIERASAYASVTHYLCKPLSVDMMMRVTEHVDSESPQRFQKVLGLSQKATTDLSIVR